eukprot:scaffold12360_cov109-Isochrysis_galbana.AAC.8
MRPAIPEGDGGARGSRVGDRGGPCSLLRGRDPKRGSGIAAGPVARGLRGVCQARGSWDVTCPLPCCSRAFEAIAAMTFSNGAPAVGMRAFWRVGLPMPPIISCHAG